MPDSTPTPVTLRQALRVWAYIGLNSFGGPTGQIAVMHKVLVEQKRWISEERFLHALHYCMLLPGPEATQLATYIGWLLHRTPGGLIAGLLFILPGFLSILALSIIYSQFGDTTIATGLLFGLGAAVLAIILEAVLRLSRRVLHNPLMVAVAALSFAAIFFLGAPFPLIILTAALLGLAGDRLRPDLFEVLRFKSAKASALPALPYACDLCDTSHTKPSTRRALATLALWLPLWLGPVLALHLWLGPGNVFAEQALFFSKAAVVTFGGAYAVLAYIAQQGVEVYHWLLPGEMLTGLGLAESTPGPLIQVVQFVGYLGAHRDPGPLHPVAAGLLASLLTTWVTFTPCFLWIFLGAPYMESLRSKPALTAALSTITAAVVGVVLNLCVWFALHTLFDDITEHRWHALTIPLPRPSSINIPALAIALLAALALLRLHWGILRVIALGAALGLLWSLAARAW